MIGILLSMWAFPSSFCSGTVTKAFLGKPGLFIMLIPSIQLDLWQSFSRLKWFSLVFPRPALWICISCSYTLQWLFQALYYRLSVKQTLLTAALVEPPLSVQGGFQITLALPGFQKPCRVNNSRTPLPFPHCMNGAVSDFVTLLPTEVTVSLIE